MDIYCAWIDECERLNEDVRLGRVKQGLGFNDAEETPAQIVTGKPPRATVDESDESGDDVNDSE